MNENNFVRKDVFDAEVSRIMSEIDATNKRIDDLQESLNRNNTIIGFSIALFAILMAGIQIAVAIIPIISSVPK